MTEWAGDKRRQDFIVRRIERECKKEDPINMAGATGTVMANVICDYASSYEIAIEGLTAHYGDMKRVVMERFNKNSNDA